MQPEFHEIVVYTTDGSSQAHRFPKGDTPEEEQENVRALAMLIMDAHKSVDGSLILGKPFVAYRVNQITKIVWEEGHWEPDKPAIGFLVKRNE